MARRAASGFVGFDELAGKLDALKDDKEVGIQLRSSVRSAMNGVKKEAKARIPVGIDPHKSYKGRTLTPGFAKRSIRVISKIDRTRHKAFALLGVRAEAFYAIQYVELGTAKMAARPWLRPAFLASKDEQVQAVGEGMRQWIVRLAARHAAGNRVSHRATGQQGAARSATLLAGLE